MVVMPSANRGVWAGWLAGRFPGSLGHLYSPGDQRGPFPFFPYALDNGAYGAFLRGVRFPVLPWLKLLDWAQGQQQQPLWVLVPDVVGNKSATLASWETYAPVVMRRGFTPAFAVQDGMTPADVPQSADVIFVGGSTEFKWNTLETWTLNFNRVHVGRVNSPEKLKRCAAAGVESVDGTGWLINPYGPQARGLITFLENQSTAKGVR